MSTTDTTKPIGRDIQADVIRIATAHRNQPLSETLAAVAAYFTQQVFTPDQVRPARDAIAGMIAADVLSQIKTVGENVGNFSLPDADGRSVTLSNLLQSGPVVVVFYRGEWCPYCNLHLSRFQHHLEEFRNAGATLIAISPQTPDHSDNVQTKNSLEYSVLSDVGSHVARQFGVAYDEPAGMAELHNTFGVRISDFNGGDDKTLPIPATFVIDQQGKIAWVNADFDYTRRSEPLDVLAALKELS
jgi:peroxiredoxin